MAAPAAVPSHPKRAQHNKRQMATRILLVFPALLLHCTALRVPVSRRAALAGAALAPPALLSAPPVRASRTGDLASALADPASPDSWRRAAPTAAVSKSGWSLRAMSDAEIKKAVDKLPDMAKKVALYSSTERPFTGAAQRRATGVFFCANIV